jgi:hypothetical protein
MITTFVTTFVTTFAHRRHNVVPRHRARRDPFARYYSSHIPARIANRNAIARSPVDQMRYIIDHQRVPGVGCVTSR